MTPNPYELLTLAMYRAAARGDDDAVSLVARMTADPDRVRGAIGDDGASAAPAEPTAMADDAEPMPAKPVTQSRVGAPASGEVALAGRDGKELARLIRSAKSKGVRTMAQLVGRAVERWKGFGPLLRPDEVQTLADAIAAVNSTAGLLGRSRVREMQSQAALFRGSHNAPQSAPFSRFAEDAGIMATPEAAVSYFSSLYPDLSTDPKRFGESMRRQAFTLAASANQYLTNRVHGIIAKALAENAAAADATVRIRDALTQAGVSPRNPQYSEMVFRTNAMDAFQTGMYEEGRADDVKEMFPAWQYLGIADGRQGADHAPKFGKFYPSHAAFSDVRGPRPFNCRCSMRWVDRYEWDELQSRGVRVESSW